MKYKLINKKSYNLHMIKTNKFKTLFFKICFTKDILKKDISINSLLVDNLLASCKKYPTKKELSLAKLDLYGPYISGVMNREGNKLITNFSMSILNEKYTEENMTDKSLELFNEILFNPNVKDDSFDSEIFEVLKKESIVSSKKIKERPRIYSEMRLREEMDIDNPISYRMSGYEEDFVKVNNKSLYEYYKRNLKESTIDIFVVGDFSFNKMESLIEEKLHFEEENKELSDFYITYRNNKRLESEVFEKTGNNQSNLFVGCYFKDNLTPYQMKYVMPVYNFILGSSPDSKFFKNIREKLSFAYSINSYYRKVDDILTIFAGISYKNYEKTLEEIKKEMKEMIKGNFTDRDIENAKEAIVSALNQIDDVPEVLTVQYYNMYYLGTDKIKDAIKGVMKVTKKDIVSVSKMLKIDTIFLLKEGESCKE